MFRSGALYHAVMPWLPKPQKQGSSFTPGRISIVFFTPQDILEDLQMAKDQAAERMAYAMNALEPTRSTV